MIFEIGNSFLSESRKKILDRFIIILLWLSIGYGFFNDLFQHSGGRAAREPRGVGERRRPVEVHAFARGCGQGKARHCQAAAQGKEAFPCRIRS